MPPSRFDGDLDERTRLRTIAIALTALDLVGARVALRHHLIGEPLRLRIPASVPHAVALIGWGTAVSAPWAMDAALLSSLAGRDGERARKAARVLGALRVVGVLAEPATWGRRRPRWAMVLSAGHLALGGALLRTAAGGG